MERITWDQVIERANKGKFGDVQIDMPSGTIQRGPISTIRRGESNLIVFETIWMARKESNGFGDYWYNDNVTGMMVSDECRLRCKADGTICFGNSHIGEHQLFRKHTGYLEPHQVSGLEPDDFRRSRAWMYDIPLDSKWEKIIERVVKDLGGDGLVDYEDQVRVQEEAEQFAAVA